jgi:Mg2+ and Co2+ transporter CorA
MKTKEMPLIDEPGGFWIIIGIMVICSLAMLAFFKRKKWL